MSLLENKAKNKMPHGTAPLFLIQIVSALSFSILYSTLVLYMRDNLGLPLNTANSIMGVFMAFNYALHLIGGFLGGRLLSYRLLFCIGMVAQFIGCILLSVSSLTFFYYGLAAFLTGSSVNVTCLNCMLTQLFTPDDMRREKAFFWNYAGMNIGFFVGFSLSGMLQISQNYQLLFILGSLGNAIALLICLFFGYGLVDRKTNSSKKDQLARIKSTSLGIAFIALLPFILSQIIQYADWANQLVLITGLVVFGLIFVIAHRQDTPDARNKLIAFLFLMSFSTIFWMLYQIAPMGLTLFIDNNVQRHYANWIIPPQWFQNINTITIVIGGPILGWGLQKMRAQGMHINIPTEFALSLLLIGIAFALLPVAIAYADSTGMVNPGWIVLSYVLQSIGELLISPVGFAMIGFLAPISLQGVMMGMWLLNTGVGATLSSYSSNLMITGQANRSPLITNSQYSHVFLGLGISAILSSIIMVAFIPKLKYLMQEKNEPRRLGETAV